MNNSTHDTLSAVATERSPFYVKPVSGRFVREQGFRERVPEETIAEGEVAIERKTFVVSVKENHQGRFCRIIEEAGGRRNCIIIPASGLADFVDLLQKVQDATHQESDSTT